MEFFERLDVEAAPRALVAAPTNCHPQPPSAPNVEPPDHLATASHTTTVARPPVDLASPNVQAALHGASQYLDWLDGDYAWADLMGPTMRTTSPTWSPTLRERPEGPANLAWSLPTWMKTAKHRDEVLAALARMRASLVDG